MVPSHSQRCGVNSRERLPRLAPGATAGLPSSAKNLAGDTVGRASSGTQGRLNVVSDLALVIVATCLGASLARADDDLIALEESAVRAAAAHVAPSVVQIETVGGLERSGQVLLGTGPTTGLIVADDGHIISSAFNFAQQPASILVRLPDGQRLPARVVATDHTRMLTLLKVDAEGPLPVPETSSADSVRVGQWAIAVGRTFSPETPNVSVGIVSAVGRVWGKAIQTDAKISPQNYGGPLVDIAGRVMGVLVPLSPEGTGETAGVQWYDSGIGFAVPMDDIQRILPRLMQGEDMRPGLLGISLKDANPIGSPVVIASCRVNSPAAEAGLEPDDQIVAVDGATIEWTNQLYQQLKPKYAGETVHVAVRRDDEELAFDVELAAEINPYRNPLLGILPAPRNADGVVVHHVYDESPAANVGLQAGDVILRCDDADLPDRESLRQRLAAHEVGQQVRLEIDRDGETLHVEVPLAEMTDAIASADIAASRVAQPVDDPGAETGIVALQVPEFPNDITAYVPTNYTPEHPPGVVVWLHGTQPLPEEDLLERWRTFCEQYGLVLLAPRAATAGRWNPLEVELVGKALAQIKQTYKVDSDRIALAGYQTGGVLAYVVTFRQREQFRGVAGIDAPLRVAPPDNDPAFPLSIFATTAGASRAAAQIRQGIERLKALGYSVIQQSQADGPRYPNADELDELARWAATLDRL